MIFVKVVYISNFETFERLKTFEFYQTLNGSNVGWQSTKTPNKSTGDVNSRLYIVYQLN